MEHLQRLCVGLLINTSQRWIFPEMTFQRRDEKLVSSFSLCPIEDGEAEPQSPGLWMWFLRPDGCNDEKLATQTRRGLSTASAPNEASATCEPFLRRTKPLHGFNALGVASFQKEPHLVRTSA
jgi:hypothetical protein